MALQHLRSGTANKRPIPDVMASGQLAVNTNEASPGLFFKDSNGDLVKVGPVHIGTTAPNSSPASTDATALVTGTTYQILTVGTTDFTLIGASSNTVGVIFTATGAGTGTGTVSGQQGVEKGEQWLDTTGGTYVLKIYDGTAWRSESGTFVDANGDNMTGNLTLGTTNIVLNATTGAGTFVGDVEVGDPSNTADTGVFVNETGRVFVRKQDATVVFEAVQGTTTNVQINCDGSATYSSDITANSFESTVTTGTAPFTVASTTAVTNLNADLLDGQEGSYYLNTSTSFSGDVSGTYNAIVVADDSHNHIISNVDGLQTALDGKADTGDLADKLTTTTSFAGDVSGTYNTLVVADDSHNHVISNVDGLQTALDAKADSTDLSDKLTTLTAFGGDVSGTYDAIVVADDSHNHVISNVDGLQTALDAKLSTATTFGGDVSGTYNAIVVADDSHNHVISNVDGLQTALDDRLTTTTAFSGDVSGTYNAMVVADDSHNHVISNVDGLQTALDAKADSTDLNDKLTTLTTFGGDVSGTYDAIVVADDSHNHVISNVDGLQTALDGKADTGDLADKLTTTTAFGGDVSGTYNAIVVADDSHNHVISNVDGLQTALNGKLDTTAAFGGDVSGTYDAIVVADDSHNHIISNVDGLQTALDAKADSTDLNDKLTTTTSFGGDVSGTYNAIVVADDSHNHVISNVDGLQTALDGKVDNTGDTITGAVIVDRSLADTDSTASITVANNQDNTAVTLNNDGTASFSGLITANAGVTVDGPYTQTAEAVAALDINLSTGNYFTKTISANSTFTFSNAPASGTASSFTLELTHTSGTVTWPTSVKWPLDTAPTLTTGKTHLFMFVTDDGGTRYRGAALVDYTN